MVGVCHVYMCVCVCLRTGVSAPQAFVLICMTQVRYHKGPVLKIEQNL